ncbi:response regulator [Paenibacillaceae bacterium]|nr:response regulator [Paenibacillaceae bacterium]
MIWTRNKRLIKHIVIVLLYLVILLGLRWFWLTGNDAGQHPTAIQGVIDLRDWDVDNANSIPLDGEWSFYPGQFVTHDNIKNMEDGKSTLLQVPGDWRSAMSGGEHPSFGYGTYQLRILIDPNHEQDYSFWITRINSSSQLEINGQKQNEFGHPAEQSQDYVPKSISYLAEYRAAAGEQEIVLLIRAANFDRPLGGGIGRSIRFGSQAAVDTERMYSIGFQLATFLILLLHAMYACILFLFNPRQKEFLVFFLLLVSAALSIVTDHDSLLLIWLPINYTWHLKLKLLSYVTLTFFMLILTRSFSGSTARGKLFYGYVTATGLYIAFLLAAPATVIYYSSFKIFMLLYVIPIVWCVGLIARMVLADHKGALFLLLASTSILSSVIWGLFNYRGQLSNGNIFYPTDMIAAIIGFSAYWFKRYFRNAEENIKLNEQLRAADKIKDQFLANTSHELRTPLHGIINIAQTIAANERNTMGEKSYKELELLITVSRRMSYLLNDLLDVARLQEKRITLNKEPLLVQSIAAGVISMLNYMIEGKPVRLRTEIPATMPRVLADEKRLVQIIFNLLHNAIKYTAEGDIIISAKVMDSKAFIQVSDPGIGIDLDTQARLFMPYEQGEQGVRDGGGIGLGLSICKQLVALHGGDLQVQSEKGKGSVFSFSLPLAASTDQAASSEQEKSVHTTEAEPLLMQEAAAGIQNSIQTSHLSDMAKSMNILAVDDDPVNLKVLASILADEPYRIQTALSAQEALELLSTEQWDLLITDVMMPNMSGYELTRLVRERYTISELPILLLTARSQPEDIYTGFLSGANDYVTKPVDALEFKYRVWSLTTLKRTVNESLRMEAAYLQAQIHPHFLFNTLNSIMALSDIDTEKMRMLADAFASYLRISFNFLNSEQLVPLSHELELVEAYLYIEKERFEERLQIVWDVDPQIDLQIPPLSLQPLVENAVKHGVLSLARGGTVTIRISQEAAYTIFEVSDNGKGMEEGLPSQLLDNANRFKGGIGLLNTNRRLVQLYGQGLNIVSQLGSGTNVSFTIPKQSGSKTKQISIQPK